MFRKPKSGCILATFQNTSRLTEEDLQFKVFCNLKILCLLSLLDISKVILDLQIYGN